MKMLILAAALFTASSAEANVVTCFSKFFNGMEVPVRLELKAASESRLKTLELRIEEVAARVGENVSGRKFSGRKYKNMMAFDLETENVKTVSWADVSFELLLPQGFFKMVTGQRFRGIITESASDGGSYNEILCQVGK